MKTKTLTIAQAFKLHRTLKGKQSRRSQWLGTSPIYSLRLDQIKQNAAMLLQNPDLTQLSPSEHGMLLAILKG